MKARLIRDTRHIERGESADQVCCTGSALSAFCAWTSEVAKSL